MLISTAPAHRRSLPQECPDLSMPLTSAPTGAAPEGITNPPIDDLLDQVSSKYALVIYAA